VKQVIEQLEQARVFIQNIVVRDNHSYLDKENALACVNRAMSCLQAPCLETPEQYEKRTGECEEA
jgi:hypothetical protein